MYCTLHSITVSLVLSLLYCSFSSSSSSSKVVVVVVVERCAVSYCCSSRCNRGLNTVAVVVVGGRGWKYDRNSCCGKTTAGGRGLSVQIKSNKKAEDVAVASTEEYRYRSV